MNNETSRFKFNWPLPASILFVAMMCGSVSAATCEGLAELKLPNTTITTAQTVAMGAFSPQSGSAAPYKELPAFCRVVGVIKPANDSEIKFEVWLPSANWNGKFHGIGNGGFAGSISYAGLAGAIARGYATASTDTGHNGGDASWALGHPEKIVDYGHRAIHEMTEKPSLSSRLSMAMARNAHTSPVARMAVGRR
ncbi:MAG: tannase/feruloyl esterase family alpha/beta hydrolase [Acidobacteria bacterium]|nr:tannase/feruloyl esterase family alpha/beta hydrolase [Acidobacteriota bacterium]